MADTSKPYLATPGSLKSDTPAYTPPTYPAYAPTAGSDGKFAPATPSVIAAGTNVFSDNAYADSKVYGAPIDYNAAGRGARYNGPVARVDPSLIGSTSDDYINNGGFNHLMLDLPPTFEKLIQASVLAQPRWWHDRIPRGAYQLFNGTVQETRIYRGGLMKYAGLSEWSDINPIPTKDNNPCGTGEYDTVKYGWEALQWSGKKSYWGSDPICLDSLKFSVRVQEQLAMILNTGAEYGIQMQEVWNRDMFIYQSVSFGRSFVMTSQFNGPASPRYYYNPFVKFGTAGDSATMTANKEKVTKPFIVIDASVDIEPLNFDVLDQVRESLKIRCPQAAVTRIGGEPAFALAVSHDDIERYIRGNEEERRYWIEANPSALIQHYGFAPTTFRRWVITNDGNQLRFKLKKYEADYTAEDYGGVGADLEGKAVWIAEAVDPLIESPTRVGVGGSPIPEDNPEYYTAELAIAPIFMNQVFTNQFVPSVTTLGSGTHFGPVTGLNGKWGWTNFRDSTNPEGNVGKFFGKFEIVPKPEPHVFHTTSFLYRRCTAALPSMCPVDNVRVSPTTVTGTTTVTFAAPHDDTNKTQVIVLSAPLAGLGVGDAVKVAADASAESPTWEDAYVIGTVTATKIELQTEATIAVGSTVKLA